MGGDARAGISKEGRSQTKNIPAATIPGSGGFAGQPSGGGDAGAGAGWVTRRRRLGFPRVAHIG